MIENFLVYSFGKLVNCTVWNWICTASDKFHFSFFCSLQIPTGVRYERCELTFRMSLFVVYTVTRHAQTRTWGVHSEFINDSVF